MNDGSLTLFGSQDLIPAKKSRHLIKATGDEDFDRWWEEYPRRVDKGAARKAYARVIKAGKATPDQLLSGARRYAAERAGKDPIFTKHPATWLNAESWANEAPPAPPPGKVSGLDAILAGVRNGARNFQGNGGDR